MRRKKYTAKEAAEIIAAVEKKCSTTEGMHSFMDLVFGPGNWAYDPDEDVWVAPDTKHSGPGRKFYVMQRGGSWFKAQLPSASDTH